MERALIARVAHEINRAYCASIGDASQPEWESAPEWQRASALAGVDMHLANPEATPEQSHESWLAQKLEDGWKYGPVKDADKKEHPCCVPYAELPTEQKSKDYLFRAVVHALKGLPDTVQVQQPAPTRQLSAVRALRDAGADIVAITYRGRKIYRDRTSIRSTWQPGETKRVPTRDAEVLLRFIEFAVAAPDDETEALPESNEDDDVATLVASQAQREDAVRQELEGTLNLVETMDKDALEAYAAKYEVCLDKRRAVAALRTEVANLIEQFGVR